MRQQFHDWLETKSSRPKLLTKQSKIRISDLEEAKSNDKYEVADLKSCYYFQYAFVFRCVYAYFVGIAYVCMWHCYWNVFVQLVIDIPYGYFVLISFFTLIFQRVVFNYAASLHTMVFIFIIKEFYHT